jgi:HSP90 family molecular chaperone
MKMMQGGDDAMPISPVKLQVNQRHPIIKGLSKLMKADKETAELIANQLLDNALATANLLDDPREMIARSYQGYRKTGKSIAHL